MTIELITKRQKQKEVNGNNKQQCPKEKDQSIVILACVEQLLFFTAKEDKLPHNSKVALHLDVDSFGLMGLNGESELWITVSYTTLVKFTLRPLLCVVPLTIFLINKGKLMSIEIGKIECYTKPN